MSVERTRESRQQTVRDRQLLLALAGNPNAGKTTLFNALTGSRQRIANYPGVTVERREAVWMLGAKGARLIDLPGLYSLAADSIDENIARDVLVGKVQGIPTPDVIIVVIDATNLERNLYLFTQLKEYGIPLVIALTMIDEAEKQKTEINVRSLSNLLRAPVVPVTASTGRGLDDLAERVLSSVGTTPEAFVDLNTEPGNGGSNRIFERYNFISNVVQESVRQGEAGEPSFSEKADRVLTHRVLGLTILAAVLFLIFLAIFSGAALPMDLLDNGFGKLGQFVEEKLPDTLFTQMLTGGVIPGVGGVLVFLPQIILLFVFISILEDVGYMARAAFLLDRIMRSFGLNGKAFVPLFSSFACAIPGIMATRTIGNREDRLATIMIAPFMSCSARLPVYFLMIPAFLGGSSVSGALVVIAMYLIGIITAIVVALILKRTVLKAPPAPLVMEMPPYRWPTLKNVVLNVRQNAWMFVKRAGTIIFALSIVLWGLQTFPPGGDESVSSTEAVMLGIIVLMILFFSVKRIAAAFTSRRVSLKVPPPMGTESSRRRSLRWNSGVVLVSAVILMWACVAYIPGLANRQKPAAERDSQGIGSPATEDEKLERKKQQTENSYAGRLGRAIEPLVKPLGFDDKMGFALIASFAAREVFVSALKIISTGEEEEPKSFSEVWEEYRSDVVTFWGSVYKGDFAAILYEEDTENNALVKNFTWLTALTTMVFFVLAMQCMSTVAVVRRETNSWAWSLGMVGYMTILAYLAAFLTYQGGLLLTSSLGGGA